MNNNFPPQPRLMGGYNHSILRPFDSVHVPKDLKYQTKSCDWPLFAGSKYQKWCSEDNAINYHAMRPIITPETYDSWLSTLFDTLVTPNHEVSSLLNQDLYPNSFCMEQENVMRWLMEQIDMAVHKLPQMQRNGPWKYEQFYPTDVQFYSFQIPDKYFIYKIVFNLYNTLRSTSTLVDCVIMDSQNKRSIIKMGFVNKLGDWGMNGMAVGSPKYGLRIDPELKNYDFGWNYGNTLQSQQFNEFGFFDPSSNVSSIEGGIPNSLLPKIRECSSGGILPIPETIGLTGVDRNNKIVQNNGQPQWVRADKIVTYSDNKTNVINFI